MTSDDLESLKERLHRLSNGPGELQQACWDAMERIDHLEEGERINIEERDAAKATITILQGKLDRALDTINKVFGIAYPHPSRTFDMMIKDMGLIDDLCRSILSDLPEREDLPPNVPSTAQNLPSGKNLSWGPEMIDSLKERLAKEANNADTLAESYEGQRQEGWFKAFAATFREALARIEELEHENGALIAILNKEPSAYTVNCIRNGAFCSEREKLNATIAKLEGENKRLKQEIDDWVMKASTPQIATLQGKLDRAIEGLKPFAELATEREKYYAATEWPLQAYDLHPVFWKHLSKARSILSDLTDGGKE